MIFTDKQNESLDLNTHLSVNANAGSGKTAVLVKRFINILLNTDINQLNSIVGITFTDKAASELKNRIFRELVLEQEKSENTNNIKLKNLTERVASLQIGTIHSFCSSILREFSNEAQIDPNYTILHGMAEEDLLKEMINSIFEDIIELDDNDSNKIKLLDLLKTFNLRKLTEYLKEFVKRRELIQNLIENVYNEDTNDLHDKLIKQLSEYTEFIMNDSGLIQYLEKNRSYWDEEILEAIDAFENADNFYVRCFYFLKLFEQIFLKSEVGLKKKFQKKIVTYYGIELELIWIAEKLNSYNGFHEFITFFADGAEADNVTSMIDITKKMLSLFSLVMSNYKEEKDFNALLDFDDLLGRTRELLKNNETVLSILKERYKYILVDEYQDTNKLQSDIIFLLVNNSKTNLFIVGDHKQSIYAFREADVQIFNDTEKLIIDKLSGKQIILDESFRLLMDNVAFVNYLFNRIPENNYVDKVEYQQLVKARNIDANGHVELLLYHPDDNNPYVEEIMIAQKVIELKISNQIIYDVGTNEARPIEYGDIAILLRSRTHLNKIEEIFTRYNIPYIITSGIGYYQTQEIYDLYNYLSFLLNNENDLALVGVLRSPMFFISDALLFEISQASGYTFWEKCHTYLERNENEDLDNALKILEDNIVYSQRTSIPILVNKIITETKWYALLSADESGKQIIANLNKFLDVARTYEKAGFNTLFDFVENVKALISEEIKEGQAVVDPTNHMVKIMTIHASKGLEFPVVFLPYLHDKPVSDTEPHINKSIGIGFSLPVEAKFGFTYEHNIISNFIQSVNKLKSTSEEKRVFYVALTRAHNMIFLSGKYKKNRYMAWLIEALSLEANYITNGLDKKVCYPFLNCDKKTFYSDVKKSNFVNGKYESELIQNYPLVVHITQGIKEQQDETLNKLSTCQIEEQQYAQHRIEPKLETLVVSATAFQTFMSCQTKYYLKYILGYPDVLLDSTNIKQRSIDESFVADVGPDYYLKSDSPILLSRTMKGKILHRIFENINDIDVGKIKVDTTIMDVIKEFYFDTSIVDKHEIADIKKMITNFLRSDLKERIFSFTNYEIEYNISHTFESHILTGVLDRFCIEKNKILIVDYKTNKLTSKKDIEKLKKMYEMQMLFYSLLVSNVYKATEIEYLLLFLEAPEKSEIQLCDSIKLDEFKKMVSNTLEDIKNIEQNLPIKNESHCSVCEYYLNGKCVY
jgi:ATP-dependent helicase/nuclease subunit A